MLMDFRSANMVFICFKSFKYVYIVCVDLINKKAWRSADWGVSLDLSEDAPLKLEWINYTNH